MSTALSVIEMKGERYKAEAILSETKLNKLLHEILEKGGRILEIRRKELTLEESFSFIITKDRNESN